MVLVRAPVPARLSGAAEARRVRVMLAPVAAPEEPGFWVKWAAGIAAAVVAGLIVAYVSGAFEKDEPEPAPTATPAPTQTGTPAPAARVRISEFVAQAVYVGNLPTARFKVYNGGDDSADRCYLYWNTVGATPDDQLIGVRVSDEFSVDPQDSHPATLTGLAPYLSARTITSGARVRCANTTSPLAIEQIVVVARPAGG
jgi:hypothetical protein